MKYVVGVGTLGLMLVGCAGGARDGRGRVTAAPTVDVSAAGEGAGTTKNPGTGPGTSTAAKDASLKLAIPVLRLVYGSALGPEGDDASLRDDMAEANASATEFTFNHPLRMPDDFNDQRRLYLTWPDALEGIAVESASFTYVRQGANGHMSAPSDPVEASCDPVAHRFAVDLFRLFQADAEILVEGQIQWIQIELRLAGGQHRRFRTAVHVQGPLPVLSHSAADTTSWEDWDHFRNGAGAPIITLQDSYTNPTDRDLALWVSSSSGDAQIKWYLNAPEHIYVIPGTDCTHFVFNVVDHPYQSEIHLAVIDPRKWRRIELPARATINVYWAFQTLPFYGQCALPAPANRHFSTYESFPQCASVFIPNHNQDVSEPWQLKGAVISSNVVRSVWVSAPNITEMTLTSAILDPAHAPSWADLQPLLQDQRLEGRQEVGDLGGLGAAALAAAPAVACTGLY